MNSNAVIVLVVWEEEMFELASKTRKRVLGKSIPSVWTSVSKRMSSVWLAQPTADHSQQIAGHTLFQCSVFLLVCSASYAAALLFRLNDDKPQEFKKRLPPELVGNAFRLDPMSWHEVCTTELIKHTTDGWLGLCIFGELLVIV